MRLIIQRLVGIFRNRILNPIENRIVAHLKLENIVFFESVPDFGDEAKAVYNEMMKRGYDKKYKMLWAVDHIDQFENRPENNTYFIKKDSKEWIHYSRISKVLLSGNHIFYKAVPRKEQINYYLGHGAALKSSGQYCYKNKAVNYVNIMSPFLNEASQKNLNCSPDYFTYHGMARNDIFYKNKIDLHSVFTNNEFTKCIIWLPTFRQNLNGNRVYSHISQPIIHSIEDARYLNEIAKKYQILIVLKPHFNQNMENIRALNLSNFLIIDDKYIQHRDVTLYDILAASDGLLTDYSSVYWDYLNADKPIGLCWEDFSDFTQKCGLVVDSSIISKAAEPVNSMIEMERFLHNISIGYDYKKVEREELNALINGKTGGKSAKLIVDFIESLLEGHQDIRSMK